MMDSAGGVIGTIIVLVLFWKFSLSFGTIVFIAAGISAISILPLFLVKEKKKEPYRRSLIYGIEHLDKRLKYILLVTSVFAIANFGLYMFIILKAKEVSGSIIFSRAVSSGMSA